MTSRAAEAEERESVHRHVCVECGEEWAHRSRQCELAEEAACWECRRSGEEDVPF